MEFLVERTNCMEKTEALFVLAVGYGWEGKRGGRGIFVEGTYTVVSTFEFYNQVDREFFDIFCTIFIYTFSYFTLLSLFLYCCIPFWARVFAKRNYVYFKIHLMAC